MIGKSIAWTGGVTAFFLVAAAFYVVNLVINWWYYARAGAEAKC